MGYYSSSWIVSTVQIIYDHKLVKKELQHFLKELRKTLYIYFKKDYQPENLF